MEIVDEEFRKREESDDLLFEAYDEPIKSKAIKLAKKALEVNPNNIDAENFITKFETNTIKKLNKYEETLNKEKANLEKDDFFNKENIGILWGLLGTRPYMRTKHSYMLTLMELGRYTEAVKQVEDSISLKQGLNKFKSLFKDNAIMSEFDKDVFELMIERVIIGEKDSNGKTNPRVITFILKSGNEIKCQEDKNSIVKENLTVQKDKKQGSLQQSSYEVAENYLQSMCEPCGMCGSA